MEIPYSDGWSLLDKSSSVINVRPNDSYFAMIGKAIISSPTGRMALHEIYNYIRKNYPYYKRVNPAGWKNSVRHNLSLNECFIKAGKCEECKGHYWAIHPANIQDFSRGDFNRRKAKAKARLEQATETQNAALSNRIQLWAHQHYYPSIQWPFPVSNYPPPLSNDPEEGSKGPTNDKLLKFNISNLINTQ